MLFLWPCDQRGDRGSELCTILAMVQMGGITYKVLEFGSLLFLTKQALVEGPMRQTDVYCMALSRGSVSVCACVITDLGALPRFGWGRGRGYLQHLFPQAKCGRPTPANCIPCTIV